jgi:hypothetical protein
VLTQTLLEIEAQYVEYLSKIKNIELQFDFRNSTLSRMVANSELGRMVDDGARWWARAIRWLTVGWG